MIILRMNEYLNTCDKNFHKNQYGFRINRTTRGAVKRFEEVVLFQKSTNDLCLAINLDIRNAFNSLRWSSILTALKDHWNFPGYIVNIINSNLLDRSLIIDYGNNEIDMYV